MHTGDLPETIALLGAAGPVLAKVFTGIVGKCSILVSGVFAKVQPAHHLDTADGLHQGRILSNWSDNALSS
jgi:hypothetical protein